MIGSLAKTLMQRAVRIAGDAAKDVQIVLLGPSVYDPVTGTSTRADETFTIGRGILARITEEDVAKYKLTKTTHKVTVAYEDYEANGAPELPTANDRVLIAGKEWMIDKIVTGSMEQSLKFFVCED
jgi:hypothetical protein